MKKILSLILCGFMCCTLLTGCGNENNEEEPNIQETGSDETISNEEETQSYHEDNQDLVDALNTAVTELYDEAE